MPLSIFQVVRHVEKAFLQGMTARFKVAILTVSSSAFPSSRLGMRSGIQGLPGSLGVMAGIDLLGDINP
jgi:hypothetical protein